MRSTSLIDAIIARESAALGCAMLSPAQCRGLLASGVTDQDFIGSLNKLVLRAIRQLSDRGEGVEYASVGAELLRMGAIQSYSNAWSLITSMGEGIILNHDMFRRCDLIKAEATAHRKAGRRG